MLLKQIKITYSRSEACKALKYEIGSSIAELPRILFLHGERERRLVLHLDR